MGRWLPLLTAAGCGNPITNAVLLEDAEFLDALPNDERHAPPSAVANATLGDSVVLGSAQEAVAALTQLTDPVLTVSDALRAAVPGDRTDSLREWDAVSVVDERGDEVSLFWVQARILRTDDSEDLVWSVEVATESGGPWKALAEGRHDPAGVGAFEWDLAAHAAVLGETTTGTLSVTYDDTGAEGAKSAQFTVPGGFFGTDLLWTTAADLALGYTGTIAVTADGATWPAAVQVLHVPERGGRAIGTLYKSEAEALAFESCWDASGDTTWLVGDSDVLASGSEAGCAIDPF